LGGIGCSLPLAPPAPLARRTLIAPLARRTLIARSTLIALIALTPSAATAGVGKQASSSGLLTLRARRGPGHGPVPRSSLRGMLLGCRTGAALWGGPFLIVRVGSRAPDRGWSCAPVVGRAGRLDAHEVEVVAVQLVVVEDAHEHPARDVGVAVVGVPPVEVVDLAVPGGHGTPLPGAPAVACDHGAALGGGEHPLAAAKVERFG